METSSSTTEAGVWTQYLPESWISDHLLSRKNGDGKPFTIVDVGGGYGQELTAFLDAFPNLEGRYILQDRSAVPPSHTKNSKTTHSTKDGSEQAQIEVMRHDFFNPQPVLGADVYLLSRIVHNWPDEKARVILSHLRAAMSQDSTLLVIDRIFSDKLERVSETMTMLDLGMMASLSALERTEGQFRELLSSVGLRLMNVWRAASSDGDNECRAILQIVKG
ncbi:S-adenosyl-L-methionine-dependent methyltransferase [Aspergillus californicus]